MKFSIVLFLIMLPLTVSGQDLECCRSVAEVEKTIDGLWTWTNINPNDQMQFEFTDGKSTLIKHTFDDTGKKMSVEQVNTGLKVFKTDQGFSIDFSEGTRLVTSSIKVLNKTTLILVRRDGKETKHYRVFEKTSSFLNGE